MILFVEKGEYMKNLKVVFMGTPDFAVPVLKTLIENTDVVLVVTQPDALVGRKKVLTPSPVKITAQENNIEVFAPIKIREEYEKIIEAKPDIIITCAYGQIIPKVLLDLPKHNCINVHASLLPKYRGGSPIGKSIINGDTETGITIMYMAEGMDDGDIIKQESINILDNDNIHSLSVKLSELGAELLIRTLPSILDGTCDRIKQNEKEVTFAYTPKRSDEFIDFNDSAKNNHNKIRALTPYTYCTLDGKEMKIVSSSYIDEDQEGKIGEIILVDKESFTVKCSKGLLKILEIVPFSKKQMKVRDYFNGVKKETLLGKCLNEEK